MKNNIKNSRMIKFAVPLMVLCVGLFVGQAKAADATTYSGVNVRMETPDSTLAQGIVYVSSDGCTVTDSTGTDHVLTGDNALCALDQAIGAAGLTYELSYYDGFGLLLNSIGDYTGDGSNYWLYYVNYESPSVGMSDYDLSDGDELIVAYGGFTPPLRLSLDKVNMRVGATATATLDYYSYDWMTGTGSYLPIEGATVTFEDETLVTDANGQVQFTPVESRSYTVTAESDGYVRAAQTTLRAYVRVTEYHSLGSYRQWELVNAGLQHLEDQIDEDGRVDGSQSVTEWSAMAFAKAERENTALFNAVKNYRPTSEDGTSEIARHILALEAIGEDSRNLDGANYVKRLKATFSNGQFGSAYYCNDDIFAALALLAADEEYSSDELHDAVESTYACINEDGGVAFSVGGSSDIDTTGAWLGMAARLAGHYDEHGLDGLKEKRQAAVAYLRNAQNPDGGWSYTDGGTSNAASTAWVLQAFRARRHAPHYERRNNLNGFHFLDSVAREKTGAFRYDTFGSDSVETLNTAYAIIVMEGGAFPVNKAAKLK